MTPSPPEWAPYETKFKRGKHMSFARPAAGENTHITFIFFKEPVSFVQSTAHLLGALDALVEHQGLAIVGEREQEVKDRMEIRIVGGKQP